MAGKIYCLLILLNIIILFLLRISSPVKVSVYCFLIRSKSLYGRYGEKKNFIVSLS